MLWWRLAGRQEPVRKLDPAHGPLTVATFSGCWSPQALQCGGSHAFPTVHSVTSDRVQQAVVRVVTLRECMLQRGT